MRERVRQVRAGRASGALLLFLGQLLAACAAAPHDADDTLERSAFYVGTATADAGVLEWEAGASWFEGGEQEISTGLIYGLAPGAEVAVGISAASESSTEVLVLEGSAPLRRGAGFRASLGLSAEAVVGAGSAADAAVGFGLTGEANLRALRFGLSLETSRSRSGGEYEGSLDAALACGVPVASGHAVTAVQSRGLDGGDEEGGESRLIWTWAAGSALILDIGFAYSDGGAEAAGLAFLSGVTLTR